MLRAYEKQFSNENGKAIFRDCDLNCYFRVACEADNITTSSSGHAKNRLLNDCLSIFMDILIIIKSTSARYLDVIESLSFIELQK